MRYIVFDVETPNGRNHRMSAIGVCEVEDGEITRKFYSLVNPETHFERFNMELTGITPAMVADAPTFPELWAALSPLFEHAVLVAHNATFDLGVLRRCLADYGIDWQSMVPYLCTVQLGRKCIPQSPNHRLNTLCDLLGITLDHHHAGSDAEAAARLLLHYRSLGCDPAQHIKYYALEKPVL